jgi:hypothetical protein
MQSRTHSNSISNEPTEDLAPTAEDGQGGFVEQDQDTAYPLKENQKPVLAPCSLFVYHWLVKRANPGVTAASNTPKKNLTATAPLKLLTAAKQAKVAPHMIIQNAEYLAKGSLCRRRLVGYL